MDRSAGWTPVERRIFTAVVAAATGEPPAADVADAVAPFLDRLSRVDRWQLRALLLAFEYGAPLLRLRPRRFSALPPDAREACLAGWAASRLALRRRGAAVLKALSMLAYYGRDAAWPEVGYDGPWLGRVDVPVLPAAGVGAAVSAGAAAAGAGAVAGAGGAAGAGTAVGAGAAAPAGAPAGAGGEGVVGAVGVIGAAPAADRPRPGPAGLPAGITLGRHLDADLHIRAEAVVIGLGAGGAAALDRLAALGFDVVGVEAGGAPTAAEYNQRELDMLPLLYHEAGLRATADKAIAILQGRGVGGSTLHNTGLVYGPPAGIVQRWREEHGFPLGDVELDRHVACVLDTLRAVPIPEDRINRNNDVLRRGADRLGWRRRIALHNRVECSGCGYCMLGCAYNRKNNAALTYVPRALGRGARILADAAAERIEGAPGARRVVCALLDAAGRPTGRRAVIEATVVLVGAGALETPALLLRSGLGNGRVGRGLRLHPAATVIAAFGDNVVAWRGLPQAVLVEEFASFLDNGRGGFLLLPNPAPWPGLLGTLVPGTGARHRAIMRELPRLASASVLLHDEGAGRVRVGADGRPRATYWPDRGDRRTLLRGIEALARIYLAAGAERVYLPLAGAPPVRDEAGLAAAIAGAELRRYATPLSSVHPQASCALGANPATSATDPTGALRGAPGVYVCDASLFPTSVGVPPQVTIMALAAAVAERAAEALR
ncbi:MAG TPA: GMC family oxidoreductase [Longimicrobiales bacterium]